MTLLTSILSGIAIVASTSALVWQRDITPEKPAVAPQPAQAVFHPPIIDLGSLARACGRPG